MFPTFSRQIDVDCSVGIETSCGVLLPLKDAALPGNAFGPTDSHPASCSMLTAGVCPQSKADERQSNHWQSVQFRFYNTWNYTTTLLFLLVLNTCPLSLFHVVWAYEFTLFTILITPHYDPGVDSPSNRNEYQEHLRRGGGKGPRCVGLTTWQPSADCLEICEPQLPGTPRACPGLKRDSFTTLIAMDMNKIRPLCAVFRLLQKPC